MEYRSIMIQTITLLGLMIAISSASDLFTSTDKLRELSSAEPHILPDLDNAIASLHDKINLMRILVHDIKYSHNKIKYNDLEVAGHPVHAYNLIKRWRHLETMFMETTVDKDNGNSIPVDFDCHDENVNCTYWARHGECKNNPTYMLNFCKLSCKVCALPKVKDPGDNLLSSIVRRLSELNKRQRIPKKVDYEGAAQGIIRLQRTYKLNIDDIAKGNIHGYQADGELTASDFLHIGKEAVKFGEWGYGLQWLRKANEFDQNERMKQQTSLWMAKAYIGMEDFNKASALLLLAYGRHEQIVGGSKLCYDHDDRCLTWADANECSNNPQYMLRHCPFVCNVCNQIVPERFPGEYELTNTLFHMKRKLREATKMNKQNIRKKEPNTLRSPQPSWRPIYEKLCRGKGTRKYPDAVCRYRFAGVYWNIYKEEILSMNPRIAMVYDVINDTEADLLRHKAKNRMSRAQVGYDRRFSSDRVSTVGWLGDSDPFIKKISERVELITGLEVTERYYNGETTFKSSDEFQAVNYGIGGHYEPHVDYFEGEKGLDTSDIGQLIMTSGDRLATFLLYLTEVKGGGGTVYPRVRVYVPPVKNAAAFWFNARISGEYDRLTMHAGCPILLGEKWVCNKWIREFGNHFNRKCALKEDAEYS